MAIDLNPAEGRILLCRGHSLDFYPWYLKGGVITRVAGKRVYYVTPTGQEKFTHEYAAICDTFDEEERLLQFTALGKARVHTLRESLQEDDDMLRDATPKKRTRTR